jgi:hypothetical protein
MIWNTFYSTFLEDFFGLAPNLIASGIMQRGGLRRRSSFCEQSEPAHDLR